MFRLFNDVFSFYANTLRGFNDCCTIVLVFALSRRTNLLRQIGHFLHELILKFDSRRDGDAMAWLEVDLSLGVRRILAIMLFVCTFMMAFAGFGLLVIGLVLQRYIAALVEPPSKTSSTTSATISSVMWYTYSVVTVGALATVTYALASQVSTAASA